MTCRWFVTSWIFIFNLEIFSNMISNLRNDYNETKKDFDIESTRYDENNTTSCLKTHIHTMSSEILVT